MSDGHRRIGPGDRGWPSRLDHLEAVPRELWLAGSAQFDRPAVAMVGARRATLSGIDIAHQLAGDLAALGLCVVSGLARGIDAAAHRGAIQGGGFTVAVLGCGIDVCYPPEHAALKAEIAAAGAVVSELEPGTPPLPWQFPRRNRIIAALALAVVVVEASERSGALSTARWAADLGREVLAVPGSIRNDRSRGTNRLIRDGARPLLDVGDLLEAVPELAGAGCRPPVRPSSRAAIDPVSRALLDLLSGGPAHPDAIGAALGLDPASVARRVAALEVAGAVARSPGGLVIERI